MMLYMLDTDTASYIVRGQAGDSVLLRLEEVGRTSTCVSAMTRAELLFGLRKLPPQHRVRISVKRFLDATRVLAWEPDAAAFYAEIRYELTRTGKLIGEMDMLIAAHAIAADAVLVTNNVRHFRRIKLPLMMENWLE